MATCPDCGGAMLTEWPHVHESTHFDDCWHVHEACARRRLTKAQATIDTIRLRWPHLFDGSGETVRLHGGEAMGTVTPHLFDGEEISGESDG